MFKPVHLESSSIFFPCYTFVSLSGYPEKRASLNTFGKIDKNISCLSFVYLISNANLQWLGGTSQGFSLACLLAFNESCFF